ncbi:MAG: DUF1559 domain-containing protein, partial [Thermoguttaceae bacterium]
VIAIIGMLAGLMLPAVQQAREAGRRAECINNQRNVALALLNYEGARKAFPGYNQKSGELTIAGWYVTIFPYIEQTNLYETLQTCTQTADANHGHNIWTACNEHDANGYESHAIGVFKCPSSGRRDNATVDYVANCGQTNVAIEGETWTTGGVTWTVVWGTPGEPPVMTGTGRGLFYHFEQDTKTAVFFNKPWYVNTPTGSIPSIGLDYITTKNGSSNTLLTSENINAGTWKDASEWDVGFCYGQTWTPAGATPIDWESATAAAPTAIYVTDGFPYWINSGKTGANLSGYRRSRPSSNHPGIVVAAFCDGSVRPISDSMDKATFRDAMNPTSGRAFAANAFN